MNHGAATLLLTAVALSAALLTAVPAAYAPAAQERYRGSDLLPDPVLPDTSAGIGQYVLEHLDELATPEFRSRKAERRTLQRAGYTAVLHDLLALDAAGALLSFIRTRLQLEYSLPHNTIYFRDVNGASWALPEDWTFPADPWAD